MPRPAVPSNNLLRSVRRYFGLHQFELAAYLGISPELVKHIEAGRRGLSSPVLRRLHSLALLVPEPLPPPPLALALADLPAPAPGPLQARLAYCTHKAGRLRRELAGLVVQATHARRWQQALPVLLAAPGAPDAGEDPARAARAQAWLLRRPAATSAGDAARYHLLRLQAEALEAEAAALAALMPPAPGG